MTLKELNLINEARLLIERYEIDELRQCEDCNIYMVKGYVTWKGTFCEACHPKHFTPEEWQDASADDNDDNYYTEWSENVN